MFAKGQLCMLYCVGSCEDFEGRSDMFSALKSFYSSWGHKRHTSKQLSCNLDIICFLKTLSQRHKYSQMRDRSIILRSKSVKSSFPRENMKSAKSCYFPRVEKVKNNWPLSPSESLKIMTTDFSRITTPFPDTVQTPLGEVFFSNFFK